MNKLHLIIILGVLLLVIALGYSVYSDNFSSLEKMESDELSVTTEVSPENGMFENSTKNVLAYVALGPKNQIGIIDLQTDEILRTIEAGNNPHGIAFAGGNIFTTATKMGKGEMMMEPNHDDGEVVDMAMMKKFGSNEVSVTDIETGELITKIDVGAGTHHMASTPDGTLVLATVPSRGGIVLIDTSLLTVDGFIETDAIPNYVVVSPDGKLAYVTNKGNNTISVVDLRSDEVLTQISVGVRPDHMVLSQSGKQLYVTNAGDDTVSIIDTTKNTVEINIAVGETPHGIGISNDGSQVYVANTETQDISVINTGIDEVVKTIAVGSEIEHLEVDSNSGNVLVNSEDEGSIFIVDPKSGTIVNTIKLNAEPHQLIIK